MTANNGPTVGGDRASEVADYVEEVREALRDLPPSERDDLLEELPAHLTEVAAEDPAPLRQRLGPPEAYAAELRSAADPAADQPRHTIAAWAKGHTDRVLGRLRRLDVRVGPMIGYTRVSEFGRLLVPAWWVLRGYLAAMVVVLVLDRNSQLGLLPRLGGSTLVGLAVLAGFIGGSIWLAQREARLDRWPRRAVLAGSVLVVMFGLIGFATVDDRQRSGGWPREVHLQHDRYEQVQDVFVVDRNGRLVTDVLLLDQEGNPLDIGWEWCQDYEYDRQGRLLITYPRCPDQLPWWSVPHASPEPSAEPTPQPSAGPSVAPSTEPSAEPTMGPAPVVTLSPIPQRTP